MHSGLYKIYSYQEYGTWQASRQADRQDVPLNKMQIDRKNSIQKVPSAELRIGSN
jgi:hypothetical protein